MGSRLREPLRCSGQERCRKWRVTGVKMSGFIWFFPVYPHGLQNTLGVNESPGGKAAEVPIRGSLISDFSLHDTQKSSPAFNYLYLTNLNKALLILDFAPLGNYATGF